ncbi:spherulation-specific family 4 protein [Streptomyces griseoincarnatus]|uniref:spherulation-specific family 4 protein n=1 Tax=Streptomyces TaxID=1883 RepID=UPI00065326DE|nr:MULTISPECIES: spherulation-specific family 4 protein [unclassified Streptomyces]MBU5945954.1 spherulation-specific family 4 protein [Streptomyces sp. PAM3C]WPW21265.1 spherulation-specific family 4 protein [Streptomyces griseoincarnatus]
MPYLTRSRQGRTATGLGTGLGIPGVAHPLLAPDEWNRLGRPGAPLHWVVLNVADGPGVQPDPHCLEAAGRLRNAGVRVLGHIDTAYGLRGFGEIVSDAHRFHDWYRVDGFLLDRCPAGREDLPEVRRTVATLRVVHEDAHVVLGHGTHPYPGYAEHADQLVTFSGPWSDYRWSQVAEWTADHPPERFCHFVHGVPRPHLEEALRIARWQGAGTIYFTDHSDRGSGRAAPGDPWGPLPGYWDDIVSRVGTGVSE